METQQKEDDIEVVYRNYQLFDERIDDIFNWNKEFQLLTKPDIPMKDLDRERDFDIIQQIVEEGCYLFMLLSTIQLYGMSSLMTNHPRVEEERRHEEREEHEEQEERRHEESITDQLETELEAILELTFLFDDEFMEFGFYDFFTPNTIDKKKHTAKLQALRKRACELVFYLSGIQNIIGRKLWMYQQVLNKGYTTKNQKKRSFYRTAIFTPSTSKKVCASESLDK